MKSKTVRSILSLFVAILVARATIFIFQAGDPVALSITLLALGIAALTAAVLFVPSGAIDELREELNQIRESLEQVDRSGRERSTLITRKISTLETETDERLLTLESKLDELVLQASLGNSSDSAANRRGKGYLYGYSVLLFVLLSAMIGTYQITKRESAQLDQSTISDQSSAAILKEETRIIDEAPPEWIQREPTVSNEIIRGMYRTETLEESSPASAQ